VFTMSEYLVYLSLSMTNEGKPNVNVRKIPLPRSTTFAPKYILELNSETYNSRIN